ncbi:hypothetical protein G647_00030 [Cladophialophora carrionii CBS 160.54]|uniref:Uncharacterized protein n=1 Tax=Cladophialophora carrionii CBS 160.54 TaxID=1279043 RepID=V9DLQ1_9EURO|nr:uncharacterized protein G647_00030 [Cladophialophora carrionii CBS 160.54]ETI27581.1 hypothetical protein G647_00030 [Cladophialophora carrionii CBS 160.54]
MFMVLLAGYTTSTLPTLDMFTINAAQIANTEFNNGTGNGCNCAEIVNGTLTIHGTAVINGTLSVGTAKLDVAPYYSVFTINYCQGGYLPDYADPSGSAVLTHCQKPSLSRHYDLVDIIEDSMKRTGEALGVDLSLDDLDWPQGISNAFTYVNSAGAAFIGFLLVGLASLILATLAAFLSLFRATKTTAKFLFITSVIALVALTICSVIATAIVTIVVNGINANGDDIGVSADQGNYFMAMIWIAVALLFVSTLTTTATLCIGSSRRSHAPLRQYEGYDMPPMGRRKPVPYYIYSPDPRDWDPYSSRRTLVNDGEYNQYGDEFR